MNVLMREAGLNQFFENVERSLDNGVKEEPLGRGVARIQSGASFQEDLEDFQERILGVVFQQADGKEKRRNFGRVPLMDICAVLQEPLDAFSLLGANCRMQRSHSGVVETRERYGIGFICAGGWGEKSPQRHEVAGRGSQGHQGRPEDGIEGGSFGGGVLGDGFEEGGEDGAAGGNVARHEISGERQFAPQILKDARFYFRKGKWRLVSQEETQFRQGRLGRHVVAGKDTGVMKGPSRGVQVRNCPLEALRAIHNDDAAGHGLGQGAQNFGTIVWSVSGSEGFQDDSADRPAEESPDGGLRDAREEAERHDIRVEGPMGSEGRQLGRLQDFHPVDFNVHPDPSQRLQVGRIERIKVHGLQFGRPVPAEKSIIEVKRHFRDDVMAGNRQGAQQIVTGVVAQFTEGNLRSSDNDRLAQVFQQERQGTRRVGHGVSPVQDEESIKLVVIFLDIRGYPDPIRHGHVTGIEQPLVLQNEVKHPLVVDGGWSDQRMPCVFKEATGGRISVLGCDD